MTDELHSTPDPLAGPGPQAVAPPLAPPAPAPLPSQRRGVTAKLVFGIGVIFFGLAMTLEQLHEGSALFALKLWPLILVAMGVVKLRQAQDRFSGSGYWLLMGGAFLLLYNFAPNSVENILGPLLVVGFGVFIVLRALRQKRDGDPGAEIRRTQGVSDSWVSGTAIFGAFKRRVSSQAFQGGDVTAIFGGFEVDLLDAKAGRPPMQLDLFVLFGGGEIHVPEGWDVEVHATSIFGSVEQKQMRPSEPGPDRPKLILTGTTLFGGVEIRH